MQHDPFLICCAYALCVLLGWLVLDVIIDPFCERETHVSAPSPPVPITVTVPDAIAQAFSAALQAKIAADASFATKQVTAAALAKAKADDDAAATQAGQDAAALTNAVTILEAAETAYFAPGGTTVQANDAAMNARRSSLVGKT